MSDDELAIFLEVLCGARLRGTRTLRRWLNYLSEKAEDLDKGVDGYALFMLIKQIELKQHRYIHQGWLQRFYE